MSYSLRSTGSSYSTGSTPEACPAAARHTPGAVRAAGGLEYLEHARHGVLPSAFTVRVPEGPQARAACGLVLRVEPFA